jgi:hypothetical protein
MAELEQYDEIQTRGLEVIERQYQQETEDSDIEVGLSIGISSGGCDEMEGIGIGSNGRGEMVGIEIGSDRRDEMEGLI